MSDRLEMLEWMDVSHKIYKFLHLSSCYCKTLVNQDGEVCSVCAVRDAFRKITVDYYETHHYIKDLKRSNGMACQSPANDCNCHGCWSAKLYREIVGSSKQNGKEE